jgi:hypothetical protein
MSLHDDSQNDPLDAMLARKGELCGDENLRQAVLANTLGVIRRRRRLKRCAMAATLLGCYLAGIATVAFWQPGIMNPAKPSTPQIIAHTQLPSNAAQTTALSPAEELAAIKAYKPSAPRSRFEVLRREGDRYLQDPEKLQLAVRTYSNALKYASAGQRAISPEHDTWLLMALKDAQFKEIKNENSRL